MKQNLNNATQSLNQLLASRNSPTMACKSSSIAVSSTEPLTVLQILLAALQLPTKATKLFSPLLVLSFLSSSSIFLYFTRTISPPLQDLFSKFLELFNGHPDPQDIFDHMSDDFEDISRLAFVFIPSCFLVSLLLTVATVYTFATTYTNKSLSYRQLVSRVSRRWYQTMVTSFYLVLFGIGYTVVSLLVVATALLVSDDNGAKHLTAVAATTSLSSFAVMLFVYVATRGSLSLVITVVEETWGIGALSWSVELFIGNKKRGTLLTTILMSVRSAIYGMLGIVIFSSDLSNMRDDDEVRKYILIGAAAVALWELYSLAVYTVLYYECRKSHGLEDAVAVEEQQGFIYASS